MQPRSASARSRSRAPFPLLIVSALLAACSGETLEPPAPNARGAIAGVVREAGSGVPLAGAEVRPSGSLATVTTGEDGAFRFDEVAPGSYALTAARAGFRTAAITVAVSGGATAGAELALEALPAAAPPPAEGSVTGRLLRRDGRFVGAGVPVEIHEAESGCGSDAPAAAALSDPLGRYLAQALPPGDYLACVETPLAGAPFAGSATFAVAAGGLSEADVTLEPLTLPAAPDAPGPVPVASLGERVRFTFTIVSAGQGSSTDVIVTDTLPLLDDPAGPPGPGDRDGDQALRYVTDRPTFDPDAIRYYVDEGDDAGGTQTDVCFQAPAGSVPAAFTRPAVVARCGAFVEFATIGDARAAAEAASRGGDQIVAVEYFDEDILARTEPGGPIEAEDAFEVTLEAIHSISEFRRPDGSLPGPADENGAWFNIVTAISAENDFVVRTACIRVVEALLEVRKTVSDAAVPAGSQTEFLIEIGNTGSADLVDVVVSDTLDPGFGLPATGDPGLVMVEELCAGCTLELGPDSSVITVRVPSVPSTDLDADGRFDDAEGFRVANLVVRTPLRAGTFCNRVTVADAAERRDTDLACVVTQVEVELDLTNEDGTLGPAGEFQDVETFRVGDSVAYRTSVTNRSTAPATDVRVLWELAPGTRILELTRVLAAEPASIACSTASDTCSVEVAELAPGASIVLGYLALARASGDDVNRLRLSAAELSLPIVNEEPTTILP